MGLWTRLIGPKGLVCPWGLGPILYQWECWDLGFRVLQGLSVQKENHWIHPFEWLDYDTRILQNRQCIVLYDHIISNTPLFICRFCVPPTSWSVPIVC